MNQIIRELRAAANALRAASAEVDDISYILGWADGLDHAVNVLDDADTSGPLPPGQHVVHINAIDESPEGMAKVAEAYRKRGGSGAYSAHGF